MSGLAAVYGQGAVATWTNEEGVTIEAELLGYDLETKEISLGKADGTAYMYPARELSLDSKLRLFREPIYIEARKGQAVPYQRLARPIGVVLGLWMLANFIVFWIGVAVVMRDDSLGRALGAFVKYFLMSLALQVFLVVVGIFFFTSETGQPDAGWWLAMGVLTILGSFWIFCWSVRGSYESGWGLPILAFILCLVLWFGLGIAVEWGWERWLDSAHANRLLTKHVFVPLELL